MSIPKLIHQTDKSHDIRETYRRFREGLLSLHPDWEYKFYDDAACRKAVEQYLPAFLPIYDSASIIQKADIFRIVIVYGEGGFYLDMDIECLKPLDDLCEFRCVFAEEITLSEVEAEKLNHRDRLRVANYMFGSEAGHPFLLRLLSRIAQESRREIHTEEDVLDSTGPGLVTTVYHDTREEMRDVVLLRNLDRTCSMIGAVSCHFGNYARHHHEGTWRWIGGAKMSGRMPARRAIVSEDVRAAAIEYIDGKIRDTARLDEIYVLETCDHEPDDGLSHVHDRTSALGVIVKDTKSLSGRKVLLCNMPHLYTHRLSKRNKNVIYTTFETTELPGFWVEAINEHYHYCVVPHHYVKTVFEDSGVRIPVKVIQQGFSRLNRQYGKTFNQDEFRIGFLGIPYERKNLFKLYQACVNLLPKIPGLRLAVHAADLRRLGGFTSQLAIVKFTPFVDWTEGPRSEDGISKWYSELACYVFPSSGEGWSFTPRESLYMGVPTLITDIPVHRELVESGYYGVIPVRENEDSNYEGRVFGKWDRVSVEDIEKAILELYKNYGKNLIKAIEGGKWIENKWTNESSQQRMLEFLQSI
jgi:glycosyltransferase involved in cell wall biosynthesis